MIVAFYAPMKSPSHPVPSGDRRIARLLMKALEVAGYTAELASELRTYDKVGNSEFLQRAKDQSATEAKRLISEYETREKKDRPVAWFTYHLYHKAPDWIGPAVCRALDIPYFVAEASHAPKRRTGPWAMGYRDAAEAISKANRVFYMTQLDGECLRPVVKDDEALCYLPPFIDIAVAEVGPDRADEIINAAGGRADKITLLSVAMMRGGDKLESYRQLSHALDHLAGDDWQLVIAGDGDERATVEIFLAAHRAKIVYTGALEADDLSSLYQKSDMYIWPAHGEAYGMAFLEAQLNGLPVVAGNIRGVPDVVLDGVSGLLSAPGDMIEFADNIRKLLDNTDMREKMGKAARHFVMDTRSLEQAAGLLSDQLGQVVK